MKKASFKKLSILGLVLLGASGVTATILPNKANTDTNQFDITLTQRFTDDGGPILTCQVTENGPNECTYTAGTITTGMSQMDSTVGRFQTERNTTTVPV